MNVIWALIVGCFHVYTIDGLVAYCHTMGTILILILNLTHWGRATHICVSKLTVIGSDNGLSPGRRHAIICTNAGILLIGPLGTNFNEIFIEIHTFSFKKIHLKMSSGKWRPFCLGLNVLKSASPPLSSLCGHQTPWNSQYGVKSSLGIKGNISTTKAISISRKYSKG